MTGSRNPKKPRLAIPLATLVAILIAVAVWSIFGKEAASPGEAGAERSAVPTVAPPHRPSLPSLPARTAAADPANHPLEYADDGVPYMPPGPNDPHPNTYVHPHPITPEHKRIFQENALLYQLNEAMDGKEVPRLRQLLKNYRDEYPEDPNQMQAGYALIADCLEHPGDATIRAAAQRYFKEEIASTLRRFVLRHCLEPRN